MRTGSVITVPPGTDTTTVYGGAEVERHEAQSLLPAGALDWRWTVTVQYADVLTRDFDRFDLEASGILAEGPLEVEIQWGMGPVAMSRRVQVPALGTSQGITGESVRVLVRRRRQTLDEVTLRVLIAPRAPSRSIAVTWVNDATNPQVIVPLPQLATYQPTVKAASTVSANFLDPFANIVRQDQVRNVVAIPPIAVALQAQTAGGIFAAAWEVIS